MMGRQPSKITKISGRLYRVTPFDPAAEKARRRYDKQNMRTVSTRVPVEVAQALKEFCDYQGITVYRYLQTVVTRALRVETAITRNRAEWRHIRQAYGGMVAARHRRQNTNETGSFDDE